MSTYCCYWRGTPLRKGFQENVAWIGPIGNGKGVVAQDEGFDASFRIGLGKLSCGPDGHGKVTTMTGFFQELFI